MEVQSPSHLSTVYVASSTAGHLVDVIKDNVLLNGEEIVGSAVMGFQGANIRPGASH